MKFKDSQELALWAVANRLNWKEDDHFENWMLTFASCVEVSSQEALVHVMNGGKAYFWFEEYEDDDTLIPAQWTPLTFRALVCDEWNFQDFIAPSYKFGVLPDAVLLGIKSIT